ncbi:MAG: acyl-CoA/acyl-ACP dehydrogenase [Planctomycetota bacterium]|nr:acyl-CoA/acyl-ACP dehydrogenase [Planctomycetota bacterium]
MDLTTIRKRLVKTGKMGGCVTEPLAELDAELEVAISQESGKLESKQWLTELRRGAGGLRSSNDFPALNVRQCARIENAISHNPGLLLNFYVWLASGCLTTAFVMTQRSAAVRRIETSSNESTRETLLSSLRSGVAFATVGISHLTTSRRHLSQPPLCALQTSQGWLLEGFSPWVTGARFADTLVVGAVETAHSKETESSKSRELLFAIPSNRLGLEIEPCGELMALNGSATGPVRFCRVMASKADVLHGPVENVMEVSSRKPETEVQRASCNPKGGAGGLHTSALALGHAAQAIEYLLSESRLRIELLPIAQGLRKQWEATFGELCWMDRQHGPHDPVSIRKKANDLALNCTQAALVAAKGVGFTDGHDVGRWCREALFFLVWSCPQSVAQAHLCSFMS